MSAGVWQEAKAADGRIYYWNNQTKETRWTKPEPDPGERAKGQTWREYSTPEGRKYYHNVETKVTVWEMPDAFKQNQTASVPSAEPEDQTFNTAQLASLPPRREAEQNTHIEEKREYARSEFRSSFVPATANEPEFDTSEEAEAAFLKMLRKAEIGLRSTWEDAMKAVIREPYYRSIKDPKDRRAVFEKFIIETRAQNKEKEKDRIAKLRSGFFSMFKSHADIKFNTRWRTARSIIEGETIFRSAIDDTERRQLFDEYIENLIKRRADNETAKRKSALEQLTRTLESLELEPYTRWADAQSMIYSNSRLESSAEFSVLTKTDVLTSFEDFIKSLERTSNDARQANKTHRGRKERQCRDAYVALLTELRDGGSIKAGMKWKHFLPLIERDARYIELLGMPGSSPLELFWDIVEEEERSLRTKRNDVLDALDDHRFEITTNSKLEDYLVITRKDHRTQSMLTADLKLIFERLKEKLVRRREEDLYQAERAQRKAVDALRSRIRRLEPPVRASDSWETVRPRLESSDEYRELASDEMRQLAFDKVIRRLRDREGDELERPRRGGNDRERRDSRTGQRHGRDARSRTPEYDVYEADRRKAMAARERQYRKASGTGLSPAPPSPQRRDRNEDKVERNGRPAPVPYDHDRRSRDFERERGFNNRADPRHGLAKELDYGESAGSLTPSAGRRRRDSEAEDSGRTNKRQRREGNSTTSAAKEEDYRSGSEEGEIEEA